MGGAELYGSQLAMFAIHVIDRRLDGRWPRSRPLSRRSRSPSASGVHRSRGRPWRCPARAGRHRSRGRRWDAEELPEQREGGTDDERYPGQPRRARPGADQVRRRPSGRRPWRPATGRRCRRRPGRRRRSPSTSAAKSAAERAGDDEDEQGCLRLSRLPARPAAPSGVLRSRAPVGQAVGLVVSASLHARVRRTCTPRSRRPSRGRRSSRRRGRRCRAVIPRNPPRSRGGPARLRGAHRREQRADGRRRHGPGEDRAAGQSGGQTEAGADVQARACAGPSGGSARRRTRAGAGGRWPAGRGQRPAT